MTSQPRRQTRNCVICSADLQGNRTKLCGNKKCKSEYNSSRQREARLKKKRLLCNENALQSKTDIDIKNPPLRYTGSKWRLSAWIINQFPKHHHYVEPFCGGASIFFQKQPSAIETLNDLNSDIVNFFQVLRTEPEKLIRAIKLTPYSRGEWENAHSPAGDSSEKARRFYIRSRMSFGSGEGKHRSGWRYTKNKKRNKNVATEWNTTQMLWDASERLKDAQIENDDALTVIERFSGPDTLFYVDPPYVLSTRYKSRHYYSHEMTDAQHKELADVLQTVEGMVIVSGYENELYEHLYRGWEFIKKPARTINNNRSMECLWIRPKS